MKKALIIASTSGFIKGFLMHDVQILQNKGFEVHCAANASKMVLFNAFDYFNEHNVIFHQIDFSSTTPVSYDTLNAYKQYVELMKEHRFEVVHCHTPIVGAIVRFASQKYRRKGTKVIYTTHGLACPKGCSVKDKLVYGTVEKICAKWSDVLITINEEDFEMLSTFARGKVYHVNGVGADLDKFQDVEIDRNKYRMSIGVSENDIMILSVGELSIRKNHQVIIKALAKLNDSKLVYVICGKAMSGEGTYNDLVRLAEEYNVRVLFLGFRQDIPEINACADIAALPSIREGLGMAGIEALASGVPVVGTSIQGIKDYVISGETGYLSTAYDVSQFAENIEMLMDESIRRSMKEKCILKAKEFGTSVSWEQMENIYNSVLG